VSFDLSEIVTQLAIALVTFIGSWVLARIRKAKRDVNAAFRKLRMIEKHLGLDLDEGKFKKKTPKMGDSDGT